MKKIYVTLAILMGISSGYAQQEEEAQDTTRINLGKRTVIIIGNGDEEVYIEGDEEGEEEDDDNKKSEAHWAGVDFGFSVLMNENMTNSFEDNPYWRNDPAKSQVWNLNIMEHKFNFGTPYVGLTTGLGFSFTSVAFNDDYLLSSNADTVFAVVDTVNTYTKNKLKATYLTVPLLLEFNTSRNNSKNFYLAGGVVGGVRIASKIKRKGEFDGKEFVQKEKGTYGLNPFKADALVRMGYNDWGIFASYSLLPLFEQGKTTEIYPLNFGLSLNF